MKILICDDEIKYINDLKVHVEEYMKNRFIDFSIDTAMNPNDVLKNGEAYDLAFLDIQMNEIDGISLAKELKSRKGKVIVFFVTSFNQYQDDAMDLQAFRFFEKPFDACRLYSGLDKAMEYIDESYVDLYIPKKQSHCRILVDDIMYIENQGRKVTLHTKNERNTTNRKFEEWCELLPTSFFYPVHKSFLVNLHYIENYNYTELFLTDGTRIAVASRKQADFHKYWFAYLRRR